MLRTLLRMSGFLCLAACAGEVGTMATGPTGGADAGTTPTAMPDGSVPEATQLAQRQLNLGLALRTAALKLVGDLPTVDDQLGVAQAASPRQAYEARIDKYLADPRFANQLVVYHRNTFKMGGDDGKHPSFETAPTFAAEVVFNDRPYTDIFTATDNTCPSFDSSSGKFTDGQCNNGAPVTAGVLTDPGVQAQFVSNMAFRRVRWVQEVFDCRRFPTEYSSSPTPMGAGTYTSPWPFDSITGGQGARVDFHDTSAVICANCHTTMNHIAPLFANFDDMGQYQSAIQVTVPIDGLPKAQLGDWLPSGETTAWRFGVQVSDLGQLGQALSKDPQVLDCVAARAWNFAMSKGDIVGDAQTVPENVLAPLRTTFLGSNYSMKQVLRQAFTSDDFVKF